ncbi:MAG: ABC transporter ATP-binding protein, partial [Solobacterium sp.]|nr:ABC transporter ATP-binding protein [Solobacterium sp.]
LIFADEPTGNLDTETEQEIIRLFQMLAEKYGKTIIVVTHSDEVSKLSDRRIMLKGGKLHDLK